MQSDNTVEVLFVIFYNWIEIIAEGIYIMILSRNTREEDALC